MSNFIFSPNTDTNQTDTNNQYYCVMGSQDFIDDEGNPRVNKDNDKRILAKKILREDGSVRYSIKLTSSGKMQNPISMYGVEKNSSFLDRVCRSDKKFKDVSYKTFEMYTNFLKTKNIAWLHNAEREAE